MKRNIQDERKNMANANVCEAKFEFEQQVFSFEFFSPLCLVVPVVDLKVLNGEKK